MKTQEIYHALDDLYATQLRKHQLDIEELRQLVRKLDPTLDRNYAAFIVKKWMSQKGIEIHQPTAPQPSDRPQPYSRLSVFPSLFVFVAFVAAALAGYAARGGFRQDVAQPFGVVPIAVGAIVAASFAHCGAVGGGISGFMVGLFAGYVLAPFVGGGELLFERAGRTHLLELLFGGLPVICAIVGAIICDRWKRC